jgi:hypothetical protein
MTPKPSILYLAVLQCRSSFFVNRPPAAAWGSSGGLDDCWV